MANAEDIIAPIGPHGDNHQARSKRLSIGVLAVYGSGMLVQDTLGLGLGSLLLFYLTIICGMSGSAAGLALGMALVVDSFIDPLVGSVSDNSRSRHGRRHPFMILSAIPIAIGFGLLFSIPTQLTGWGLFAFAMVMLMLVRVGLSFFQVPYIALGAELSDDYAERSTIVASRVLFTVVAGLAAAILAYGVFLKGHDGQLNRAAYAPYAWTCSALVLLGAAVASFGTLGMRDRLHAPPDAGSGGVTQILAEVAEVFRNRSFCILFSSCLILFIGLGVAGQLGLHANTYFWKLQPPELLKITLVLSVGYFLGVFIAAFLAGRLEKRTVALLGISMIGLSQFGPVSLKLLGVIPPGSEVATLMVGGTIGGIGAACALIGFQSMMADAADEHEHLFGARREGLYFAGISFSAKASSGLGAIIAGVILDVIGFPHGLETPGAPHVAIPLETVQKLALSHGPGAAMITAVSVAILTLYRRGKSDHEDVRAALLAKRGTFD
ncbi:MFS transporter [Caulobacter sp. KR2-114]|uniref:MFS transporter n=1 Tax=Caulobacter sp. KR2-114 TaxID=3400912 RepID=UPI003C05D97F